MDQNISHPSTIMLRRSDAPTIKQYVLNANKQWEEVDFPISIPDEKPAYQDALDHYLKGNPFSHNLNESEFKVNTIEEYYVKDKDEYILLSDLMRSGQYSRRQKRKILKRNFNEWIKSYNKEKYESVKVAESTFTMIGKISFPRFGFIKQILFVMMFVVMISIVYHENNLVIRLFRPKVGNIVHNSLNSFFANYQWAQIAINISLYAIIVGILVLKFIDTVQNEYRKNYYRTQKMLKNAKNILNRDFRRKSQRARRYYLAKVLNKPDKYPPLRMDQVGESRMTLQRFNNVSKQVVVSGAKIKRWNWLFVSLRFILIWTSLLGGIGLLVLTIYQIIKDFLS